MYYGILMVFKITIPEEFSTKWNIQAECYHVVFLNILTISIIIFLLLSVSRFSIFLFACNIIITHMNVLPIKLVILTIS